MELRSNEFKARAAANLGNEKLQKGLGLIKVKAVVNRANAVAEFGDFETLREAGKEIRNRALADLDLYLERFEREATARGAVVHWAENASEACRIVVDIAKQNGVKTAAKSKSMVSEEVGLNDALIEAGIEPIETDLGEYILQINDAEPPSHIVMPVIHKTAEDVADLFHAKHGTPRKTDPAALTREAREILRPKFLSADMGVSGANFLIAETGSTLIVTNEGNGRLCTTLPRLHVAITGIEKVVATLEDVSTLLRLLPRSATGQAITNYVSLHTGPKRLEETDGPQQFHIVLVDNGRSKLLAGEMREMLRCIRCGACMNHCPVYGAVGGHAYGWVYPGPMGSVLTPLFVGLDATYDLPNACTLNGRCQSVCPVRIPLPELLRELRHQQHQRGISPPVQRRALGVWRFVAERPGLYQFANRLAARALKSLGGRDGRLRHLPFAGGWTALRDLPAPEGKTFLELWHARKA